VLAGFVLFMVPEPRTALKEIRRVLTEENGGGAFALSSWLDSEWYQIMLLTNKFRSERKPMVPRKEWWTIEGVRGELGAAGFRDVDVHPVTTYLPFQTMKS
jgi:ubiquinone/menaquinone biosynthesis C-methylase UbiE